MRLIKALTIRLLPVCIPGSMLLAQTQHFQFTSNTGNSANVAVLVTTNPNINGTSLATGDEIGVFTPAGLCVGGIVWRGLNDAITVWGDNEQTGTMDGMQPGELIHYRVWRQSTDTEFASVAVTYSTGDGMYQPNALYTLATLDATAPPEPPLLISPASGSTGLSVTPTLNWDITSFATEYRVEVALDTAFISPITSQAGITGTSFDASGLADNTTYFWRVRASNSGGSSDWSDVWQFTTVVGAPLLVSPPDGSINLATTLDLTWNSSAGATAYRLQLSTDSTFGTLLKDDSLLTITSSEVGPLTNNTKHYWRVNARNADGTSAWSDVWSFTTKLAAPVLASPPSGSIDHPTTLTLSWNSVGGATSYGLQVSTDSSFNTILVDNSALTTTSSEVGPLANNTEYFWRVRASNADGTSDWSTVWSLTTVPLPALPPTLVSPSDGSTLQPTTMTLSWNSSSGATSYRLQVSTDSSFASTIVDDSTIITPSSEAGSLSYATTYYWRVNAINSGGVSDWSSIWKFTTIGTPMTHGVILPTGWNMISSFVRPQDSNLETLTAGILDNLVIIKNGQGAVYWPAFDINDIGNWDFTQGYQVYMQAQDTLMIPGNELIPDMNPMSLVESWNMITYMRNQELAIDSALSTIAAGIIIVKNNDGEVYWPVFGIDNIGLMRLGQGYQVKLTSASTLTYPANSASSSGDIIAKRPGQSQPKTIPAHFTFQPRTGNNSTVGIPISSTPKIDGKPLTPGDEIGVFTPEGLCVGAVVWMGSNTALTIWGDDEQTPSIDGIQAGEKLHYRVWEQTGDREISSVTTQYADGEDVYSPNAVSVLSSLAASTQTGIDEDLNIPREFQLGQNYPNPFNPSTVIMYGLPKRAVVKLEVFNIIGQRVALLVNEEQEPGYHKVVFGSKTPSGVYIYRMTADDFMEIRKMVLLR